MMDYALRCESSTLSSLPLVHYKFLFFRTIKNLQLYELVKNLNNSQYTWIYVLKTAKCGISW